jgi:hypothetical protein
LDSNLKSTIQQPQGGKTVVTMAGDTEKEIDLNDLPKKHLQPNKLGRNWVKNSPPIILYDEHGEVDKLNEFSLQKLGEMAEAKLKAIKIA